MIDHAERLGLFAKLESHAAPADDVARDLGLDARVTRALLRHLAACGVLERNCASYSLPARGFAIVRAFREMAHEVTQMPSFQEVVRTGQPLHATRSGVSLEDADDRARFLAGLHRRSAPSVASATARVVAACRAARGGRRSVLDLGGGHGAFAAAFAAALPDADVTLFDQPDVLSFARQLSGDAFEVKGGDFHSDDLGGPHHAVFVSNVLSCEPDAAARILLERIRASLAPGGSIIVRDRMLYDAAEGPLYATDFALVLAAGTDHGLIRSFDEMRALLVSGGFRDIEIEEIAAEEYAYAIARA